jgi:hypothetical protein
MSALDLRLKDVKYFWPKWKNVEIWVWRDSVFNAVQCSRPNGRHTPVSAALHVKGKTILPEDSQRLKLIVFAVTGFGLPQKTCKKGAIFKAIA